METLNHQSQNQNMISDIFTNAPYHRFDLTDGEYEEIMGILNENGFKERYGRPHKNVRKSLNGVIHVLRTGCPWRDLPPDYGKWNGVYKFYRSLEKKGLLRILRHNLEKKALTESSSEHIKTTGYLDSTTVKVHQDGTGARKDAKGNETNQDIGRSVAGNTTKIHAIVNQLKQLRVVSLTPGNVHDSREAKNMIDQASVEGITIIVADKGYASQELVDYAASKGVTLYTPPKSNAVNKLPYDKTAMKERHHVENFNQMIKRYRRIATRYEKLSSTYLGMVELAASMLLLRHAA